MRKSILMIGFGYCARALAGRLGSSGWEITGTTRDKGRTCERNENGVRIIHWESNDLRQAIATANHILISARPDQEGDPFLRDFSSEIKNVAERLSWVGYLSTTGVYGDHQGGWVDEDTPLTPATTRGEQRVFTEKQWQSIADLPLHIFRLAGIYGPGRGPFDKLRKGKAQMIIKEGQIFSRIHVDDIVQVLAASIARPNPGAIYNLCDDHPAPPEDVITYAAELLGLPLPPKVPFDSGALSPMARSFYAESKRVRNNRIKTELGLHLIHPDYRSGLQALKDEGG